MSDSDQSLTGSSERFSPAEAIDVIAEGIAITATLEKLMEKAKNDLQYWEQRETVKQSLTVHDGGKD